MGNPAFWGRLGLAWCLFIFGACWCASDAIGRVADAPAGVDAAETRSKTSSVQVPRVAPRLAVDNRTAAATSRADPATPAVRSIPTLNGFGLFIVATLLGVGALWMWRRRQ